MHHRAHGWELEIGYLNREEKRMMALTALALRDGSLKFIDAGQIVGPKVLPLINRLRLEAERDGFDVNIRGAFQPDYLRTVFESQLQKSLPVGHAMRWSPKEIADFARAIDDFRLLEQVSPHFVDDNHRFVLAVTGGASSVVVTRIP